ncbi:MAG: hypothetical protein GXO29_07090, partial [Thermotogae bacterium]|nr:hypothetical protein [Thermotogota bacterium]
MLIHLLLSVPFGGPDGYGYTYLSTQDGDSVEFNFIDISSTGTPVGAGDDWCSGSSDGTYYDLGFTFPFYEGETNTISICSNGGILFEGKDFYLGLSNSALPYTNNVGFLALMWDDLDPPEYGGDIYFQSFTSCPDGYPGACAVVQYYNVPRYGNSVLMNFEAIIYDNGNIKLLYNSQIYYNDATIGIQDSTAGLGTNPDWYLQYLYGGSPSTHIPDSGTAILFVRPVFDYDIAVVSVQPSGKLDAGPITVEATLWNR